VFKSTELLIYLCGVSAHRGHCTKYGASHCTVFVTGRARELA